MSLEQKNGAGVNQEFMLETFWTTLTMKAARSFKTFVPIYQYTSHGKKYFQTSKTIVIICISVININYSVFYHTIFLTILKINTV